MKPLVIQFSGGRTSAFMGRFLQLHFPERPLIFTFENTGKEDPKTLEFVLNCDREWDLKITWLEAVVNPEMGEGTGHKIVDFESASRNGEPYEAVIAKYGLANMVYTHCTRELKIQPLTHYLRSLGLKKGDYETAIGIRADEKHRISELADSNHIIYPLIDIFPVNKKWILNWWSKQPFDLDLPERWGNCDFCFKKSVNKLVELTRESPEKLNWWEEMGRKYATTGANANIEPRQIFRGYRTAKDLRVLAAETDLLNNNPEFEEEYDCFCKAT